MFESLSVVWKADKLLFNALNSLVFFFLSKICGKVLRIIAKRIERMETLRGKME